MQGDSWGGFSALATYALLASGENPQEPKIKEAIAFLEKADIIGIYGLGIRCQVWLMLPPSPKTRAMANHDARLILEGVIKECGLYEVPLNLGYEIEATVKVMVDRQKVAEKK